MNNLIPMQFLDHLLITARPLMICLMIMIAYFQGMRSFLSIYCCSIPPLQNQIIMIFRESFLQTSQHRTTCSLSQSIISWDQVLQRRRRIQRTFQFAQSQTARRSSTLIATMCLVQSSMPLQTCPNAPRPIQLYTMYLSIRVLAIDLPALRYYSQLSLSPCSLFFIYK